MNYRAVPRDVKADLLELVSILMMMFLFFILQLVVEMPQNKVLKLMDLCSFSFCSFKTVLLIS